MCVILCLIISLFYFNFLRMKNGILCVGVWEYMFDNIFIFFYYNFWRMENNIDWILWYMLVEVLMLFQFPVIYKSKSKNSWINFVSNIGIKIDQFNLFNLHTKMFLLISIFFWIYFFVLVAESNGFLSVSYCHWPYIVC